MLISFALSNREAARVGLWPSDIVLEMPLSIIVLAAAALAFLTGALFAWCDEWPNRRRLRQAEAARALLEEQLRAANARLAALASDSP